MEIVERSEAKKAGATLYYTGRECINGHVAPRYVLSGACRECIRANVGAARAAYDLARDPLRNERATFARETVAVRFRVPLTQLESLRAGFEAMLRARFPVLAEGDARMQFNPEPRPIKVAGGTGIATFLCHRDDTDTVRMLCAFEMSAASEANYAAIKARGLPGYEVAP